MGKYTLTNKAVEDLGDIWNYTFDRWSEQQADRYYQQLLDDCQETADNPRTGKNYDRIDSRLNGIRSGKHVVFFRVIAEQEIEVSRILHGRMDLKSRIDE